MLIVPLTSDESILKRPWMEDFHRPAPYAAYAVHFADRLPQHSLSKRYISGIAFASCNVQHEAFVKPPYSHQIFLDNLLVDHHACLRQSSLSFSHNAWDGVCKGRRCQMPYIQRSSGEILCVRKLGPLWSCRGILVRSVRIFSAYSTGLVGRLQDWTARRRIRHGHEASVLG